MSKRKNRSKADWKDLIKAQQMCGLSAAEFCRQQQINSKYFSKCKVEHSDSVSSSLATPTFVKIQSTLQAPLPSSMIIMDYKHSHLQIPLTINPTWLADFLVALP